MRNIPLGVSVYHLTTHIGCIRPTDFCTERGGEEVTLLLSCRDMTDVHAGKLEDCSLGSIFQNVASFRKEQNLINSDLTQW